MPPLAKLATGLLAVLAAAWIWHAPLGHGDAFVRSLQSGAEAAVAATDVAGIRVELGRSPLSRNASLSGTANDFQRRGMGGEPGLTGRVARVPGVAAVRWTDEPGGPRGAPPLLVETLAMAVLDYLIGLGLGWLLWGRPRREGFA